MKSLCSMFLPAICYVYAQKMHALSLLLIFGQHPVVKKGKEVVRRLIACHGHIVRQVVGLVPTLHHFPELMIKLDGIVLRADRLKTFNEPYNWRITISR